MNPYKNKCPYCEKENFIPRQPMQRTEIFGSAFFTFKCTHCGKIVKAFFARGVTVHNIQKTNEESMWG